MIGYDVIPYDMYKNYGPPRNSRWLTEGSEKQHLDWPPERR